MISRGVGKKRWREDILSHCASTYAPFFLFVLRRLTVHLPKHDMGDKQIQKKRCCLQRHWLPEQIMYGPQIPFPVHALDGQTTGGIVYARQSDGRLLLSSRDDHKQKDRKKKKKNLVQFSFFPLAHSLRTYISFLFWHSYLSNYFARLIARLQSPQKAIISSLLLSICQVGKSLILYLLLCTGETQRWFHKEFSASRVLPLTYTRALAGFR